MEHVSVMFVALHASVFLFNRAGLSIVHGGIQFTNIKFKARPVLNLNLCFTIKSPYTCSSL